MPKERMFLTGDTNLDCLGYVVDGPRERELLRRDAPAARKAADAGLEEFRARHAAGIAEIRARLESVRAGLRAYEKSRR